MNQKQLITFASRIFITISALSFFSVSILAFLSPVQVMDLVKTPLPNTDAVSSIRGVYGGAGLTIAIVLIYLAIKDSRKGLVMLMMLWGFYALSRAITIFAEGPLGDFGMQWIALESIAFAVASILLFLDVKYVPRKNANSFYFHSIL